MKLRIHRKELVGDSTTVREYPEKLTITGIGTKKEIDAFLQILKCKVKRADPNATN